jgi:hypothetical protein
MRFQCLNCDKLFVYAATVTADRTVALIDEPDKESQGTIEYKVCPYCASRDIEEVTPEPTVPTVEEIGNVYVYDLTSGPQKELDQLLADGYKIVNRYSKQYHLEKPKVASKDAQPIATYGGQKVFLDSAEAQA